LSISLHFLVVLVAVQAILLAVLFGVLLAGHVYGALHTPLFTRQKRRVLEAVDRWGAGGLTAAGLDGVLADVDAVAAREALEENLSDEEIAAVCEAVGNGRWTETVRRTARSVLWWRRIDALYLLRHVGGPADRDLLVERLEDRHDVVRLAATFAIGHLAFPGLEEPLLERALHAGPAQRGAVVEALLSYGDELAAPLRRWLRAAMDAGDAERMRVGIEIAGALAHPDLLPLVRELARSERTEVRLGALRSLEAYDAPEVREILVEALRDERWEVRTRAAAVLGQLRASSAADDLARGLADGSWWVRLRSAVALRQLGEDGTARLATAAGDGDDRYARDIARYVLGLDDGALAHHAA